MTLVLASPPRLPATHWYRSRCGLACLGGMGPLTRTCSRCPGSRWCRDEWGLKHPLDPLFAAGAVSRTGMPLRRRPPSGLAPSDLLGEFLDRADDIVDLPLQSGERRPDPGLLVEHVDFDLVPVHC